MNVKKPSPKEKESSSKERGGKKGLGLQNPFECRRKKEKKRNVFNTNPLKERGRSSRFI